MHHNNAVRFRPIILAALITAAFAADAGAQQTAGTDRQEIQEVIVTAQKRPEAASRTPVSLTALSGDELQKKGIQNAEDLTNAIPNVQIGTEGAGNTNIYIRGIGSNNTTEQGDPAAAFHIDGVYLARPDQARNAFLDVERVEVLRGPQGTLYGRNATAGAVNVITNKPAEQFDASANLEVGNYNLRRAEAMVNVPVNQTLALRAAVLARSEDNYIDTPRATGNRASQKTARLHALFKFTPSSTWLVTLDGSRFEGPASPGVPLPLTVRHGSGGQRNDTVLRADGDSYYTGVTSELNTAVDNLTFTWLASTRNRRLDWRSRLITPMAPNGSENGSYTRSEQLSNEFRLSSSANGPLRWVAGLYFFSETQDTQGAFSDGFLDFDVNDADAKSRALFGQATYTFTPALRGTLGLRSTRDEKSCGDCVRSVAGFSATTNEERSWSHNDWKLGLDYDLDKNTMVYAVAGSGYKAGGYNLAAPAVPFLGQAAAPAHFYDPEQLLSIEAGIKGRILGNRGRYTAAFFVYDYKDLQVSTLLPLGGGLTTGGVGNAAKARVYGFEAESRLRAGQNGTVTSSIGLTSAKYDTYTSCTDELVGTRLDCSGNYLRNAPKVTVTLGYEHFIPLERGELVARLDTRYSSKYYNDDANSDVFIQDSYTRTNLSLRYDAPGGRWYATAHARNLENNNVVNARLSNTVFGAFGYTASPRTVGLSVGARY
ncbi:TonB-dependent receptor [Pseudoduganella umbonata]|uniref:Iron complex outermembrane receptor protein n=1 Tax=Pseudoduganella umbonata TaxID=864828 RepID=A0A7W5ECI3_9BURK|nr:TonB-dependent receptor [Pseudoduganella umbonata]MBB3222648.1 iron complex outermembrane receptor protein [Pseudoduganella umbonata]